MNHEAPRSAADQTYLHQGADGADRLTAAFDVLRGVLSECGGTPWTVSQARQEESLLEWAGRVGALLNAEDIFPFTVKGGMEHDLLHPLRDGRLWKATKYNYFGLTPGLELDLVPSGADARRFHLWESGIYHYLERLTLQNELFGQINRLEGFVISDKVITAVTSQPSYRLEPMTQSQIDEWFVGQRFVPITTAAYYRAEDNVAVFDAHDKNVAWNGSAVVPFDVIPCRPEGGFLEFIEKTLQAGESLCAVRTTRTTDSFTHA